MTNSSKAEHAKGVEEFYRELVKNIPDSSPDTDCLAAWFLGPKAENQDMLSRLVLKAVDAFAQERKDYFPEDPVFVTEAIKNSPEFKATEANFEANLDHVLKQLRGSIPLASYRNQSHMYWDITMPSAVGYFAAMLYNQNNVAVEASPVTTFMEMQVGDELCEMIGFKIPTDDEVGQGAIRPWGHITCDGSVANLESMWASRNLKYYGVTIAEAIRNEPILARARSLAVPIPTSVAPAKLIDLGPWELLNLCVDDVLALSQRIQKDYGITADALSTALENYTIQNVGIADFNRRFLSDLPHQLPIVIAPSTAHYSWPKGAAILGIGSNTLYKVRVDLDCRMDMVHLREKLDECLANRQPVMQVVVVVGSTEESAVDPLAEVVAMRKEYRRQGLEFELHVDGAWGGYFASMLRGSGDASSDSAKLVSYENLQSTPAMTMNNYLRAQFDAFPEVDSMTVDPHKSGYCPYPSGSLCYRNGSMRNMVSFTAPVVYHGGVDPTVGIYGVEGSKPGAAAAGVYLSHRVIPTNINGYGKILGKCFWNSKRLYTQVITMAEDDDPFIVVPVQRLPAEKKGKSTGEVKKERDYIKNQIVTRDCNKNLISWFEKSTESWNLFKELGSDLVIISYSFNFKRNDGTLNTDVNLCNKLNFAIFSELSLHNYQDKTLGEVPDKPMFVTQSSFDPKTYGQAFVNHYGKRLGLNHTDDTAITFLISTTQDPWVTDTADGNFVPKLVAVLRETVLKCIRQLRQDNPEAN